MTLPGTPASFYTAPTATIATIERIKNLISYKLHTPLKLPKQPDFSLARIPGNAAKASRHTARLRSAKLDVNGRSARQRCSICEQPSQKSPRSRGAEGAWTTIGLFRQVDRPVAEHSARGLAPAHQSPKQTALLAMGRCGHICLWGRRAAENFHQVCQSVDNQVS
jgi:hypothetical protein